MSLEPRRELVHQALCAVQFAEDHLHGHAPGVLTIDAQAARDELR